MQDKLCLTAYIHPQRTLDPCTGVGRHMREMLLALHSRPDTELQIVAAQDKLVDSKMPLSSGLSSLPVHALPWRQRYFEWSSKMLHWPSIDPWLDTSTKWLYSPMETLIDTRRYPIALTIHDLHALEVDLPWSKTMKHQIFRWRWQKWIAQAAHQATIILTVSEFTKSRIIKFLDIKEQKICVIGNGYRDFRLVSSVRPIEYKHISDRPLVLVVGGLSPRKGGPFIMAVADELRRYRSEILIVVVGSSGSISMTELACHPNIKILGAVPDVELAALYQSAVCVLVLSLYEGFGIPAIEAMGSGVPAIVSNRAALPEIVGNGAIVVSPDDTKQIVAYLQNLTFDPSFRHDWQNRGIERAQHFSWDRCARRMVEALIEFD